MTGTAFVDTNVFVYTRDTSEPEKQSRADVWVRHLWASQSGRLSTQVLHEYYDTVTRKLKPGLDRESARRDVRNLMTWQPVLLNPVVTEGAWQAQDRYALSWWDALIVSAARLARCRYVLSEDLPENQLLFGIRVVNPFRVEIADIN